jgi:hypothetical protein
MADPNNPYAPPQAPVEDVAHAMHADGFLPEGRSVPAGNGWAWIADAWRFTSGQRWVFLGVILLLWIVQLGVNFVPALGPVASTFLAPFLVAGFTLGCDAVRRGQQLEVGHLFLGFQRRYAGKLLLTGAVSFAMYLAMGFVVALTILAAIGPQLFAGGQPPSPEVLGQYWLEILLAVLVFLALSVPATMALLFVPPLVVLNDSEVIAAVRTSFIACLKNFVPFLIWGIVGLVMFVVATPVFLLVGWFLVGALLVVSLYMSYRDIFLYAV